jgi:hypothetical protein
VQAAETAFLLGRLRGRDRLALSQPNGTSRYARKTRTSSASRVASPEADKENHVHRLGPGDSVGRAAGQLSCSAWPARHRREHALLCPDAVPRHRWRASTPVLACHRVVRDVMAVRRKSGRCAGRASRICRAILGHPGRAAFRALFARDARCGTRHAARLMRYFDDVDFVSSPERRQYCTCDTRHGASVRRFVGGPRR